MTNNTKDEDVRFGIISAKSVPERNSDSAISVSFVVAESTQQKALALARSTDVIEAGISEARKAGYLAAGLSNSGIALPCNKNGEPIPASEFKEKEVQPAYYASITNRYVSPY